MPETDAPAAAPSLPAAADPPTSSARPQREGGSPPAPADPAQPFPPGAVIDGRYEVVREIGRGGMGRVLACRDRRIGREVAVKLLSPGRLDPEGLARFAQEARAAGTLNHPHVVAVHDVGTHDGQPYMVSELLRGQTLRHKLLDATPGPRQAVEWALQVARGLAAAHQQGIVHRDLKPDNIFITEDGFAKVLDFGIAKLVDDQRPRTESGTLSSDHLPDRTPHTETGKLLGTVGYMSPEQVRGQLVDHRADVFAFGIVLHELLTGARAFKRASQVETLYAILNGEPAPLPPHLPADLRKLVLRCLEKDPRKRAQSMTDLAFSLEAALPQVPETLEERQPGWFVRHPAVLGAFGAAVVIAVTAAGYGLRQRQPQAPAGSVAIAPFEVRAGPQYGYLGDSIAEQLAAGAGGKSKAADARAAQAVARELGGVHEVERGRVFAQRLGASSFVIGSVLEVDGRLRVQAARYSLDGGGQPTAEARVEGDAPQVVSLVEGLAQQLQISGRPRTESISAGPAGRLERAAAASTRSPEALKAFLEGESRLRRGEWRPALESFRYSVIADPSFGLGHYRLASLGYNFNGSGVDQSIAEMLRLEPEQSPRDRALFQALDRVYRGLTAEAEQRYLAILVEHPDEVEAWLQLAELRFHCGPLVGRPPGGAEEPWTKVVLFDPERSGGLSHLVDLATMRGERSVAGPLAERLLARVSAIPNITLSYQWEARWAFGDEAGLNALVAQIGRPASSSADQRAAFVRATWAGDGLVWARAVAGAMIGSQVGGAVPDGTARLGVVQLGQGRQREGLRSLVRAAQLAPSDFWVAGWIADALALDHLAASEPALDEARQYLLALPETAQKLLPYRRLRGLGALAVRRGEYDAAERMAQQLERLPPPPGSSLSGDLALALRARIRRAQGRPREALALLEQQRLVLPPPNAYEWDLPRVSEQVLHGELLLQLGQPEKALPWLESFSFYNEFEAAWLAPAALLRARAEEKLGQREKAVREWQQVAALWSEPDAALVPLRDEARAGAGRR